MTRRIDRVAEGAAQIVVPERAAGETDQELMLRAFGLPPLPVQWGTLEFGVRIFSVEELLDLRDHHNPANRHYSDAVVHRYANDMRAGLWRFNYDSIKLDAAGDVLDGQHRICAAIEATMPLLTAWIKGLDRDIMPSLDIGRRRTLQGALEAGGAFRPPEYAATLRWLWRLVHGRDAIALKSESAVKFMEFLALVNQWNGAVVEAITDLYCGDLRTRAVEMFGRDGMVLALYAVLSIHHRGQVQKFFHDIIENRPSATGGRGDPIRQIGIKLGRAWRDKGTTKQDRLLWLVRSWNAWLEGREVLFLAGIPSAHEFPSIAGALPVLGW